MQKMTITEALADIKTTTNKITKKEAWVNGHLCLTDAMDDPMEEKGGTKKVVKAEIQSVRDLRIRLVNLRNGINKANFDNTLTIRKRQMSIAEWLIWRREVAKAAQTFESEIHNYVDKTLKDAMHRPSVKQEGTENMRIIKILPQVDKEEHRAIADEISETMDELDGKLSHANATVTMTIQ